MSFCRPSFTRGMLGRSGRRRRLLITLCTLIVGTSTFLLWYFSNAAELDLLIVNGLVIDGDGRAPSIESIGIRSGHVVRGAWRLRVASATRTIDASGRVVSPGFVDVHTHVEANIPQSTSFRPRNFLIQGVTTIITGNCGRSRLDIARLLASLESNGTFINVATLVGHNSIRRSVMGQAARSSTDSERNEMSGVVRRAMSEGALGLSTGLAYVPGRYSSRDEVTHLARAAAEFGGIYATHIRDEAGGGIKALQEAVEVAREAGLPLEVSHLKSSGRAQWDTMSQRLELLAEARRGGVRIYFDAYPYTRSSTTTDVILPDWALADGRKGLREASRNSEVRSRLREDILRKLTSDGWRDLLHVRLVAGRPEWIGKTLAQVPSPASTTTEQIDNLITISFRGGVQAIFQDMSEADVDMAISDPNCSFGSDSAVRDPESNYLPHPRGMGTFPRLLRKDRLAAREVALTELIRRATSFPSDIFGLGNRGRLVNGAWADIVIFDADRIEDRADYEQPFAEPLGIDYVIVNGEIVVDHGESTDIKPPGMALRRYSERLAVARSRVD